MGDNDSNILITDNKEDVILQMQDKINILLKMENRENHYRHILLYYFNKGKSAETAHKKICQVHGEDALSKNVCQKWFAKFSSVDMELKKAPRSGRLKNLDSSIVKNFVDKNPTLPVREIAKELNISNTTVIRHLQKLGYNYESGNWVQLPLYIGTPMEDDKESTDENDSGETDTADAKETSLLRVLLTKKLD